MSGGNMYSSMTRQDFSRVRMKETLGRILALLQPQKDEMLSLGDIRSLLRPESETYKGMQTVRIAKIVGSEGRYKDFNKAFLPRHDKLMRRWMSVDEAHYRNIILPPIKLFEIGGAYFVRDGNHRVSVAKAQGAEFIDAEVISLSSEILLTPGMTRDEIKRAVIGFEKSRFFQTTKLDRHRRTAPWSSRRSGATTSCSPTSGSTNGTSTWTSRRRFLSMRRPSRGTTECMPPSSRSSGRATSSPVFPAPRRLTCTSISASIGRS